MEEFLNLIKNLNIVITGTSRGVGLELTKKIVNLEVIMSGVVQEISPSYQIKNTFIQDLIYVKKKFERLDW